MEKLSDIKQLTHDFESQLQSQGKAFKVSGSAAVSTNKYYSCFNMINYSMTVCRMIW